MKVDDKVMSAIASIKSGKLNEYLKQLDNSDFGLYFPVYEDQGTIKPLLEGYSQTERNLLVSISKKGDDDIKDTFPVGWVGQIDGKDSVCHHPKENRCTHCTTHTGPTRNCVHPLGKFMLGIDAAPELDYPEVVKDLKSKQDLLKSVATEGMGVSLLHGHSDKFMFTKLPEGYVSVVANGVTSFRKESEVAKDVTFVPNTWRSINGELRVAGGYSQIEDNA